MIKKRQHYVWRKYLTPWTTENKIWCLREGKIFNTGLMNIAQEKYFYEIKKLSKNDILFLQNFVESISSGIIREANLKWVDLFSFVHRFEKMVKKEGSLTEKLEENINQLVKNLNEDSHNFIENQSIDYIEKLLEKDSSFFENEEDRGKFLVYLVAQYLRTKSMRERLLNNAGSTKSINVENCIGALIHISTTTIAFNMFASPDFRTITFLENNTDLEFLTSDQPIINIQAHNTPTNQAPEKLEFYYPISPKLAILVSQDVKDSSIELSEEDVEDYNQKLISFSLEQIFSSSEELLKRYATNK